VNPARLRGRRARRQLLHRPPGGTPERLVGTLLAVQAQDYRAARLALRARGRGFTAADVDAALTRERSLVVAWLARGTLHLVRAEDHGWLLALTAPGRFAASRRRLGQEGVPPSDAERGVKVIERALADRGPQRRAQLAEALAAAGIRTAGQATPHLLALAALHGVSVLGPVLDGAPAYVLARDWIRERTEPADPLAELARRWLAAHGPATAPDLAAWAGLALRDARAGLAAIAPELVQDGEWVDLAGAPRSRATLGPRLLGAFDPYLLGWRDRSFAVAPEHAHRVHPGGGIIRPVALRDGRVVGTWSRRDYADLGEEFRDEIADLRRFEGATSRGTSGSAA